MIPERDRIQTVMTAAEITDAMESGDYSAEMLLQHVIRRHNAEIALADRLAGCIEEHRKEWGGMVVSGDCECEDCTILRPLDEALAYWKEARREP